MIYDSARQRVLNIDGLGWWPKAATVEYFQTVHGGKLPPRGTASSIVPAAPDAWLMALKESGTMEVEDVFAPAIKYAREGFPVYEVFTDYHQALGVAFIQDEPTAAAIFAPGGRVPQPGEMLYQPALANLLDGLVAEAKRHRRQGRERSIDAARDLFYRGEPARSIARFCNATDGIMTYEDLAEYQVRLEPPVIARFRGYDVYVCGPWSQGPVIAQALRVISGYDLAAIDHNSADYVHLVVESLKLAFADREAFYGDPQLVDVPMADLLSDAYTVERRRLLDAKKAWPGLPPAGRPGGRRGWESSTETASEVPASVELGGDTTYLCVMDAAGTIFSSTPSGMGDIVPELGISVSHRGRQSWLEAGHPSAIAPRKRPRLTPNPALVLRDGRPFMGLGTPGGDTQVQAMFQVLLNILAYGMDAQWAVEAPRVLTYSMPISFYPHRANPGWIAIEETFAKETLAGLEALGHKIRVWPKLPRKSSMCVTKVAAPGVLEAGADIRGESYALAW